VVGELSMTRSIQYMPMKYYYKSFCLFPLCFFLKKKNRVCVPLYNGFIKTVIYINIYNRFYIIIYIEKHTEKSIEKKPEKGMPKKIEEITILPFYRFLLGTPIVSFFSFFTFPDCLRSYCSLSEPLRRFCPIPGPYPLHTRSFCLAAGCGHGVSQGV
jgi:hypothetical protein